MPRKAANIPANETPAQRFVRLANTRVNNVLTNLKALGNLNGSSHVSTVEQRKQIETAIQEATTRAVQAMASKDGVQEFRLK